MEIGDWCEVDGDGGGKGFWRGDSVSEEVEDDRLQWRNRLRREKRWWLWFILKNEELAIPA